VKYAIGIDLHGTLMEDEEYILEELQKPLIDALTCVSGFARLYVATGNDLTFVRRKIPPEVLSVFDKMVLETGCVIGDGISEEVLVDSEEVTRIKEMEERLKWEEYLWVHKFDRRLASIAAFTKYGESPMECSKVVWEKVREYGLDDVCYVTYSSVAVDVVPNGFSKMTGLKKLAGDLKTIGVADSMNDIHMHLGSDISFAPSNINEELRKSLIDSGRNICNISEAPELREKTTYVAGKPATEGVIEILEFLSRFS
jgi:hydroxymethylpyrimidine pyrophosphatase-like HAD family hydrolase